MPAILAADPGVNPTLCVLYDDPGKLLAADFYEGDETSFVTVIGGKNRRRPNPTALLSAMRESLSTVLVLEDVATMPGEGSVGAFAFGHARGLLEGLATALELRVIPVRPQVWKKFCGIPPKSAKAISRHVASNIAPNLAHHFKTILSHNKADAFLMAWWARGRL
jgi:hypothetical protein